MSDVDGAVLGAGTEGRLWVDGRQPMPARPPRYETTEREQRIPMRDGVSLAATIIEPVLPDGSPPQPCVVVTNGYSGLDVWLYPNLRRLAGHGYPVVAARLRGVPPSEGKGGLYEQYGPDGYDVIEWTAAQPFCDGRVGMSGASLLGISQWLAARERPPHLVVVAPDDSPNDTYSYLWYVGGMEPGPGRKGRAEVPGVESEYAQAAAHPWFDDFWARRAARREDIQDLARAGLPALTSTGWDSYMVDAGSRAFTWMRAAGAGRRARLVIGPWRHGGMFSADAMTDEVAPGEQIRPYTGFEIQRRWFDRWLRGEPDGSGADGGGTEPPVQIFVQGPDRWRYEQDWPLPDERRVRLFLADAPSGTAASRNDGSLSPDLPAGPAQAGYDFDPATARNPAAVSMPAIAMVADGDPVIAPTVLPPGAERIHGRLIIDKTPYEAQALTWTSAVLARPMEITGYARLVLWASVSRPDADFIAELTDVAPGPAGAWTSTQITRGYLQARAQFSASGPTDLTPGDVYRFDIEFQPTSFVVAAGHRIRFTVQGAAIDPAIDVSWHGPGLGRHPFSVVVHIGPDRASFAEIPVIGDDPAL
ncbi:MAG TPA: CocE/NonD family hydrolase [Streptosporangiaceae bacterium]|nr:CocE/NonD family hydrolase [Streptosporangiaceae bacterium]